MLRKKFGKADQQKRPPTAATGNTHTQGHTHPQPTTQPPKPAGVQVKPPEKPKVQEIPKSPPQVVPKSPEFILTDEQQKIFNQVKKLVGNRYDEPTIANAVKQLKDVQAIVNKLAASNIEKGLKKDELALEKLAGAKVKQQQMLGNYKPLMQILKKSRRCIPIKYNLEELTDTKKYLENFSADAYL